LVKVNTDAAIGTSGTGLGFIARDAKGAPIFSGALFLPHRSVAQTAEALALRDALFQARQWGCVKIIVESDCLLNILDLTTGEFPLNYTGLVLEEVSRIASYFTSCVFRHIKRSLNVPAHELRQFVLISGLENVWVGECPEAITPFVLADL